MKLTSRQTEQFWEHGYVVVENVLEDGDIDPVIEEYSAWIDRRAQESHAAGKLTQLYAEEWAHRWETALEQYPPRGRPRQSLTHDEPVKVSIQL